MTTTTCTCLPEHIEVGGYDVTCDFHNPPPASLPAPPSRPRSAGFIVRHLYLTAGVFCLFVAAMLLAGWRP